MKKIYMQPSIEAYNVKNTDMVCVSSLDVESSATEGSDGWGSAQGKSDDFEDEEY